MTSNKERKIKAAQENADNWIERMKMDASIISEDRKKLLTKLYIQAFTGSKAEEVDVFLELDPPQGGFGTDAIAYMDVERKLQDFFASSYEEQKEDYPSKKAVFHTGFREIMKGFYTQQEINELLSHTDEPGSEGVLLNFLLGDEHFLLRRVQNTHWILEE